jgi:hypothetical protein
VHRPNSFANRTLYHIQNLISGLISRRRSAVVLVLGLFALSPPWKAQSQTCGFCDDGHNNTAAGNGALAGDTGDNNTAIGNSALERNVSGTQNSASGALALASNQTGNSNTATGASALFSNQTGIQNTATGAGALQNDTADNNTAIGAFALQNNTSGGTNTATGFEALFSNKAGPINTATGAWALYSNTTGQSNVATGVDALYHNQVGHDNTAQGYLALLNNTGSSNTGLGSNAGSNLTTGSNNIDIGANVLGKSGESNKIRIGKQGTQNGTFIAGIYNIAEPTTTSVIKPVYINSNGQLGTTPPASSARFKEAIKPMAKTSEAILGLKPVTFKYKNDEEATPQFGLIAEEVAKVNPDLVVHDDDGKVYTVRYEAVNAMLLNEFLKEHRNVAEQQSTIAELKTTVARQQKQIAAQHATAAQQQKQIEALTATVRKVSERVELRAPVPQIAANED